MIVLLDTSGPICKLTLVDNRQAHNYQWPAHRDLARSLHAYIRDQLALHQKSWRDIAGIGVMNGPGSFTGLRIGITVMNTLADALNVAIVGSNGEDWQNQALQRLDKGDNDKLVMPQYGGQANITQPRK